MKHLTGPRRGSILLVTFMAITVAALIATGLLLRADATQDIASVSLGRTQSRALAWSGVQAAVSRLADQRDDLLAGGAAEAFDRFEIQLGSMVGVISLVPEFEDGSSLEPETARLPLNEIDAVSLAKLPGVGEAAATTIIARRGKGFFSPESALLDLLAPPAGNGESDAFTFGSLPGEFDSGRLPVQSCTVFSFEPEIAGVAASALWPDVSGEPRLVVNSGWTQKFQDQVKNALAEPDAALAETCFKRPKKITSMSQLSARIREVGVPKEQWGAWLDLFTTNTDRFRSGVVDINQASAEVLACLPGISADAADRMVSMRATLDAAGRASVAWPLTAGLLTEAEFDQAVGFFTTRTLQYRIRIEAGLRPAESVSNDAFDDEEAKLTGTIVLEAVIDLADEHPRLAYLRDVTLRPWEAMTPPAEGKPDDADPLTDPNSLPPAILPQPRPTPATPRTAVKPPVTQNAKDGKTVILGDLKMDTNLDVGGLSFGDAKPAKEEKRPSPNPVDVAGQESKRSGASRPPADNRIGRWTFRRGRR